MMGSAEGETPYPFPHPPGSGRNRLRHFQQLLAQGTFEIDLATGMVDWCAGSSLCHASGIERMPREAWIARFHPDDQKGLRDALAEAENTPDPVTCEGRLRSAEGVFKWFQVCLRVYGRDSQGSAILGVLEDLTDRHARADTAAERDLLARVNSELKEFAYVASHDLQEPLRTITAFVELLNEDHRASLNAEGREYLDFIGEAASRLQRLINDLLTYSRMTSRTEEATELSLDDILREATRNLYAALEASEARVEVGSLPTLVGEHSRLVLLFQNLLGNAVKFRRPEVPPRISIRAQEGPGHCQVTVEDNGIGIPAEQQEAIFRIFHRLHPVSQYEGTGMGLAICSKVVERHGGRIWVESVPGEGSRFHFTLSRARDGGVGN